MAGVYHPSGALNVALPDVLLTAGASGPNQRVRVDVGQTSFFAGREFRTFKELNIAAAATYVIRAVVPYNIILFGLNLTLVDGEIKLTTAVGGTPGGTFAETLPIFPRNTMTEVPAPAPTPGVVLTAGGTHTGGTALDLVWLKSTDNASFGSSVGNQVSDERGIVANTYYLRLNAIAATTGVLSARWEERP